jgi:hypothetical protein
MILGIVCLFAGGALGYLFGAKVKAAAVAEALAAKAAAEKALADATKKL